jgi:hypothetical protein
VILESPAAWQQGPVFRAPERPIGGTNPIHDLLEWYLPQIDRDPPLSLSYPSDNRFPPKYVGSSEQAIDLATTQALFRSAT